MYDQKLRLNTIKYCNIWYSSSFIGLVYLPYYICIFFFIFSSYSISQRQSFVITELHTTSWHKSLFKSRAHRFWEPYYHWLQIETGNQWNTTVWVRLLNSDLCQGLLWSSVITKPRRRKDDLTQAKIKNWFVMYSDRPIKIGPT